MLLISTSSSEFSKAANLLSDFTHRQVCRDSEFRTGIDKNVATEPITMKIVFPVLHLTALHSDQCFELPLYDNFGSHNDFRNFNFLYFCVGDFQALCIGYVTSFPSPFRTWRIMRLKLLYSYHYRYIEVSRKIIRNNLLRRDAQTITGVELWSGIKPNL